MCVDNTCRCVCLVVTSIGTGIASVDDLYSIACSDDDMFPVLLSCAASDMWSCTFVIVCASDVVVLMSATGEFELTVLCCDSVGLWSTSRLYYVIGSGSVAASVESVVCGTDEAYAEVGLWSVGVPAVVGSADESSSHANLGSTGDIGKLSAESLLSVSSVECLCPWSCDVILAGEDSCSCSRLVRRVAGVCGMSCCLGCRLLALWLLLRVFVSFRL